MIDFTALLPSAIVAIIGFLIRHAFKSFAEKLDGVVIKFDKLDERMDIQEKRLSVTDAILKQKGIL